jgi:hypothetical protein
VNPIAVVQSERAKEPHIFSSFMLTLSDGRRLTKDERNPKVDPHPQNQRNPSCNTFVNQLINWYNDSLLKETFGVWAAKRAISNPYEKFMPRELGEPETFHNTNGFKRELIQNGQRGDVYRHILFMAGVKQLDGLTGVGSMSVRGFVVAYDAAQSIDGTKHAHEAETELKDDVAGELVGEALNALATNKKMGKELREILCEK